MLEVNMSALNLPHNILKPRFMLDLNSEAEGLFIEFNVYEKLNLDYNVIHRLCRIFFPLLK